MKNSGSFSGTLAAFVLTILTGSCILPVTARAQDLPENFFSMPKKPSIAAEDPDFPYFPILGEPDAPVTIEYFYSHSCEDCQEASLALMGLLQNRNGSFNIAFHPLSTTREDHENAVIETVMFATEPKIFGLYHFGQMTAKAEGIDLDYLEFTSDLVSLAEDPDLLRQRLEDNATWLTSLKVNATLVEEIGITQLPAFVIGNEKYEGWPGKDQFMDLLMGELGAALIHSR